LFILDHNFWARNGRSRSKAKRLGLELSF